MAEEKYSTDMPNSAEGNDLKMSHGESTAIPLRQRERGGCYVTRLQIALFLSVAVLATVFIALLAAFVGRSAQCACRDGWSQGDWATSTAVIISPPPEASISTSWDADTDKPWTRMRLPRALLPSHYDLELNVSLSSFVFTGSVAIHLDSHQPTDLVLFHANKLDVDRSTVRLFAATNLNASVPVATQFYYAKNHFFVLKLVRPLQPGTSYVLRVGNYSGKILPDLRGLYRGSYKTGDGKTKYLASSQLQSIDARKVFPCFDEPDMKATFSVTIIHDPDYTALSNMPAIETTVLPSNLVKDVFDKTPVMSTYLLAFAIIDFRYREAVLPGGYMLRMWSQPKMYNQTEYAMNFSIQCYAFFTDYFGIPDVMNKSDHVAVPDFGAGAMENWGLVIYRETALLYDPQVSSSPDKYKVTLISAHEISHTWFGNMATMRWWDDLWLNEGFASILMFFAMDHIYPEWNVFEIQLVEAIFPVMVEDALLTSHPISTPIEQLEEITQYFDTISYAKGMAILRMLKNFFGWQQFRQALQTFIRRYKFKNAKMDELWQVFAEEVNNKYNVKMIMDTWTRQMGYPLISVIARGDQFVLKQRRFLLNPDETYNPAESPYRYKWCVPFMYASSAEPTRVKLKWLSFGSATIPRSPDGWVLGNYKYVGFYRVNYERDMWNKLTEQLVNNHTVVPEANRAGLIEDAFNFARAKLLDYSVALNVTRYLKSEDNYVPWQAFFGAAKFLTDMLATTETFGLLEKYLRKLVTPLFHRVGTQNKSELLERYTRRIILKAACTVGLPPAVNYAKKLFRLWMTRGEKLPPDIALTIYKVGITEGGEEEWDYIWNKMQSTSVASEKLMLMQALAHSKVPWLLWRYATWLFDSTKIRQQDVHLVVGYLIKNPAGQTIILQFLLNNWLRFLENFSKEIFIIKTVISEMSECVNTQYQLNQFTTLFKNHPAAEASHAVDNALALMRANVKWMEDNYLVITDWLQQNVQAV